MGAGSDPIVRAIALAEIGTTAEIRVHLTRRLWERRTARRATGLFSRFGMFRTRDRNAVLLYLNLRRRRFAVIADEELQRKIPGSHWTEFEDELREDLRSTDPERAIAQAIERLGAILRQHYPVEDRSIQNL